MTLPPLARCALLAVAALPAAASPPPPAVGVASALEKLRPSDPLPAGRAIALAAAGGECESAQIAVRSERPLQALGAEAKTLTGPSRIAPALYRVATVDLTKPSGPDGRPGEWPDPLIPVRDAEVGEPRRAFPVEVAAGRLQAIWVELCVPREAAAGSYTGAVRVTDGGRVLASVPIALRVWPFALPATSSYTVTFGVPTRIGTQVLGKPDDLGLAHAFAASMLRHRVSPHGLSYDPPLGDCTAKKCALDWKAYDAEMAPIFDGTLVPGVRGMFADMRIRAQDWAKPDADLIALLRAWRQHFEARGWADRLWLYTLDEPKPSDLPELARRARAAHKAGVRVFVTSVPLPQLEGLVDAWAPNAFSFDGHTGSDFRSRVEPPQPDALAGRPFWYLSCMSHGCEDLPAAGPNRAYMARTFTRWPGYEIDKSAVAARVMGWLADREGVRGELYYTTLENWTKDPWNDVRAWAGNGDGLLLYPGMPARLGGKRPFLVESLRLKVVRDAIEDRELLEIARRNGLAGLADRLDRRVAASVRGFSRDPAVMLAAHRELGEAIARKLEGSRAITAERTTGARPASVSR
jgi:hypothetical protein